MRYQRLIGVAAGTLAACAITGATLASPTPGAGRPDQSCEEQPVRPGHASSASGSAFNPEGVAGTHYAGEQPQNSQNGQASQYDVACFQVSTNPGHSPHP